MGKQPFTSYYFMGCSSSSLFTSLLTQLPTSLRRSAFTQRYYNALSAYFRVGAMLALSNKWPEQALHVCEREEEVARDQLLSIA